MPQEQRPTEKFRTSVGGQALMEGIMMRGPEKICCAVRRQDRRDHSDDVSGAVLWRCGLYQRI